MNNGSRDVGGTLPLPLGGERGNFEEIHGFLVVLFEPWVGFRYLVSKRASVFVSVISFITVLGVVLGVAALDVTLAVMSGFEEDLKEKIIAMNAHAVVVSTAGTFEPTSEMEEIVRGMDGVVGVTPFTYQELLMQQGTQVTGVILKGADPETVGTVTDLIENVCLEDEIRQEIDGKLEDECGKHKGERREERLSVMREVGMERPLNDGEKKVFGVLLGRELADSMFVAPGETVRLVAPAIGAGPGAFPKVRTFYVAGTFRTGMWEYDRKFAFTSIVAAQRLAGDGPKIAGWEVKTDDLYRFRNPEVAKRMTAAIGGSPYVVKSWVELNRALFGALALEKFVMGLLLFIITLVASFSIVSILTLIVMEKAKEIAILKSMGASNRMILGIFAVEGFTLGSAGVLLGSALGWGIALGLEAYGFELDPLVYDQGELPIVLSQTNFLVVGAAGLAITFLATLLPSVVASRQNPVEGLQYE